MSIRAVGGPIVEIVGRGRGVRLADGRLVVAIWLRDACHCAACRRPTTNERLLDPTAIDLDLCVVEVEVAPEQLIVTTSDGHRCVVPTVVLELIPSGEAARPTSPSWSPAPVPVVAPATELVRFDCAELPTRLPELLDALDRTGAVIVEGVSADDAGLRSVAALIGPIQATNYGDTWSIDAVVDPVSEVESDRALAVHTDLPYRSDPPGMQLLLACQIDVAGGASTLVDGAEAAAELARSHPDAFGMLTTVPVEHPYVRDGATIVGRAPLIELADDGTVGIIRRAPDIMGSPSVGADEAAGFYAALRTWWRLLDDPGRTRIVRLTPGELLLFDNHRMLHGRTAFDLGTSGRRVLRGCYLAHPEL